MTALKDKVSLMHISNNLLSNLLVMQLCFPNVTSSWRRKIILIFSALALSISSLSVQAKIEQDQVEKMMVIKSSVSKFGYNRRIEKEFTQAAVRSQSSGRQHILKLCHHP
jgi:hypothetical protein